MMLLLLFFFSSRRRHTRCALVTGVQTCALPICGGPNPQKTAECLAYAKARTGAEPAKAVERHWVQIASGRNKDDMPREWARLKAKAPAVLARRTPYVAAASGTNRLLIGSEIGRAHV